MSSLRDQLMQVRETAGVLTPAAVIAAATPEDSPLHGRYEWNDLVAGHRYRLVQAAEDIRSVKITYAENRQGPKTVRAFVAAYTDEDSPTREYVPTEVVLADPFMRQMLLRTMEREINSLRQRYGHMKEFAELLSNTLHDVAEAG